MVRRIIIREMIIEIIVISFVLKRIAGIKYAAPFIVICNMIAGIMLVKSTVSEQSTKPIGNAYNC